MWEYQPAILPQLVAQCPELLGESTLVMDCITVTVPAGHRGRTGAQYKACVLSAYGHGHIFPLLCLFAPNTAHDLTLDKQMLAAALARLPQQHWHLLIDRGFLDGAWIGELHEQGLTVVLGVRSDMDIYEDLIGLSRLPSTRWERVSPPKLRQGPRPQRFVTGFTQVESWSSCPLPLSGVVIRDEYPDGTRRYQVVVSTAPQASAKALPRVGADRASDLVLATPFRQHLGEGLADDDCPLSGRLLERESPWAGPQSPPAAVTSGQDRPGLRCPSRHGQLASRAKYPVLLPARRVGSSLCPGPAHLTTPRTGRPLPDLWAGLFSLHLEKVPVAPTAHLHVRGAVIQPTKERHLFDMGNPGLERP